MNKFKEYLINSIEDNKLWGLGIMGLGLIEYFINNTYYGLSIGFFLFFISSIGNSLKKMDAFVSKKEMEGKK